MQIPIRVLYLFLKNSLKVIILTAGYLCWCVNTWFTSKNINRLSWLFHFTLINTNNRFVLNKRKTFLKITFFSFFITVNNVSKEKQLNMPKHDRNKLSIELTVYVVPGLWPIPAYARARMSGWYLLHDPLMQQINNGFVTRKWITSFRLVIHDWELSDIIAWCPKVGHTRDICIICLWSYIGYSLNEKSVKTELKLLQLLDFTSFKFSRAFF